VSLERDGGHYIIFTAGRGRERGGLRLGPVLLDTLWPFSAAGERWWWLQCGRWHGLHDHRRPVRAGLPQESHRRAAVHLPPASVVKAGIAGGLSRPGPRPPWSAAKMTGVGG
ncbi:unnamed protein product, partial [Ectocarpus fasciculatus]